jgi:hypothetical protein
MVPHSVDLIAVFQSSENVQAGLPHEQDHLGSGGFRTPLKIKLAAAMVVSRIADKLLR